MEFNFTSQICTNIEQSERLLALGLKKETADCCWIYSFGTETWILFADSYNYLKENDFMREEKWYIPAWSLHRLIEILDIWYLDLNFHEFADAYEQVISYFEERVKGGFINKEYLDE